MARYLSGIRKQMQDVSDLFTARYGKESSIAETAVKALVSCTLLEHELALLENALEGGQMNGSDAQYLSNSVIDKLSY